MHNKRGRGKEIELKVDRIGMCKGEVQWKLRYDELKVDRIGMCKGEVQVRR